MKKLVIGANSAGQRIDRFLLKAFPALSQGFVCRMIRKKEIKVGGKRTEPAYKLCEGDEITLFIKDELLAPAAAAQMQHGAEALPFLAAKDTLNVIYEDENILLADKEPGLVVHEDSEGSADTLIDRIKKYLYRKEEYRPEDELCFAPALCNRIDRNTGGIVIAAKNAEALRIMNQKVRDRETEKYYLCAVAGIPEKKQDTLTAYIFKDEKQNKVIVSDRKTPQNRTAVTKYRVIGTNRQGDSLLEIELVTGRTHQIRAQMAYIGHPLLGDGKYGSNRINKEKGYKYQALYSYKLRFDFRTDAGVLSYLDKKEFTVKDVWFRERFI